jgi:hypothetical protein
MGLNNIVYRDKCVPTASKHICHGRQLDDRWHQLLGNGKHPSIIVDNRATLESKWCSHRQKHCTFCLILAQAPESILDACKNARELFDSDLFKQTNVCASVFITETSVSGRNITCFGSTLSLTLACAKKFWDGFNITCQSATSNYAITRPIFVAAVYNNQKSKKMAAQCSCLVSKSPSAPHGKSLLRTAIHI